MSDDPASQDGLRWKIRQSLVERLLISWDGMGDMANQQRAEAAVQIKTMMDEIEAWRQSVHKAERDIVELRAERDTARREVCESRAACIQGKMPQEIADALGWDCFHRKQKPVDRGDPLRAQMLRQAANVTVERGKAYGPPGEHFERTVLALYALMPDLFARPPLPEDWAKCMIIDKLARDAEVPKEDNCIDIAGYAACLYEVRKCDSSELV